MADAMANLNALIAQGPKPIQLNDPLNQMAKIYQIKSAQQELTANEQKLAETNALREFLKSNPDLASPATLTKLTTGFGATGLAYGTKLLEIDKARRAEKAAEWKLVEDKTKYFRDALSGVNTPDEAKTWTAAIYSDPNLGPVFKGMGVTAEQAVAKVPTDPAQFEAWKRNAALGATEFIKQNKPSFIQQNLGGTTQITSIPGLGGGATVVPGSVAPVTNMAIDPNTGYPIDLNAPRAAPGAAPAPVAASAPGQPTIVRNEQDALNLAKALDRAGLPVNVLVPGPGNALAGAQPPVNALAGAQPPATPTGATPPATPTGVLPPATPTGAAGTPRGQRDLYQSLLKREEQGYRRRDDGSEEFIPGGPADPAVLRAKEEARKIGQSNATVREKLPNAIRGAKELLSKIDELIGDATVDDKGNMSYAKKPPAKGFNTAFGPSGLIARNYPGSEAAGFQGRVDEIKSGAFLEAYEILRGAGAISEKEGEKATQARTRMSFNLSPSEFIKAAKEYRKSVEETIKHAEKRLSVAQQSSASESSVPSSTNVNRPSLDEIFSAPGPQ